MNNSQYYYFISAQRAVNDAKTNSTLHDFMKHDLDYLGLSFAEVQGCYQQVKEMSFLVVGDMSTKARLDELCYQYNQECYLMVNSETLEASIIMQEGKEYNAGRFEAIEADNKDNFAGWTKIGNEFYTIKEEVA